MKLKLRQHLLAGGIGFILCFATHPITTMLADAITSTTTEVVDTNTQTIDLIARAAQLLHENSDIMMRSHHYINNHTESVLLCPACGDEQRSAECRPPNDIPKATIEDPPIQLPSTVHQLYVDSMEIRQSVYHLMLSLSIQQHALKNILAQLKAAANKPTSLETTI